MTGPRPAELVGLPPAWASWIMAAAGPMDDVIRLPTDAGSRIYFRLRAARRTFILSHARAGVDRRAMPRFLEVQAVLAANGVRVPEILAVHHGLGLILMSDLGQATVRDVSSRVPGWAFAGVYRVVRQIRAAQVGSMAFPRMTADDLLAECVPLFDYYLPRQVGVHAVDDVRADVRTVCARVAAQPAALQHRDLHARNLVCDDADEVGVVDFQDAARASCYLDIAAVIYDQNFARGLAEIDLMVTESYPYLCELPDGRVADTDEYRVELAHAGLYWVLRLLGVCARIVRRDGKREFLAEIRNSLHHLPIVLALARLADHSLLRHLTDSAEISAATWMSEP